jgi:hypothetical protein
MSDFPWDEMTYQFQDGRWIRMFYESGFWFWWLNDLAAPDETEFPILMEGNFSSEGCSAPGVALDLVIKLVVSQDKGWTKADEGGGETS